MTLNKQDKNNSQNPGNILLLDFLIIMAILISIFAWDENDRNEDTKYFENMLGKTSSNYPSNFCRIVYAEFGKNKIKI